MGVTILAELAGPFIFGVAVAKTIGKGIADPNAITLQVVLAALIGAISWNLFTWKLRLPSSSSHALIGGIVGAVLASAGAQAINASGLLKILISLFLSPVIGFIFGYILLKMIFVLCWNATPRINEFFKKSQLLTAFALGLSHGSNDGQKIMGIITLALVTGGYLKLFVVPFWVVVISALALFLWYSNGRMVTDDKRGNSFYKIRPVDGFSTQVSSAFIILGASIVGGPVKRNSSYQHSHHGRQRSGTRKQSPLGNCPGHYHRLGINDPSRGAPFGWDL